MYKRQVEYNRSAREFDIVTLDRVKRIDIEPDLDIWKEYAYAKGLHASVISYLNLKKEHFYHIENTAAGVSFVTARGWEDLSSILFGYEELGLTPDEKLIRQYIQDDDIAREDVYKRQVSVIVSPNRIKISQRPELIQNLRAVHISGMQNAVTGFQYFENFRSQKPMCI